MERPPDNQKCSGCSHLFGQHYTTYDGKRSGCSNYVDDQRDGGSCFCKEFTVTWKWTPEGT